MYLTASLTSLGLRRRGFSVSAKQDAPQHSSKTILTLHSAFTVFPPKAGFFHDEIEIPERVTILVIRLSGCSHTSRIIADSVKNSLEFLSQKWGFWGFCLKAISKRTQVITGEPKCHQTFLEKTCVFHYYFVPLQRLKDTRLTCHEKHKIHQGKRIKKLV